MGTLVVCMTPSSSTYLYMSLWQSENAKKDEINKTKKEKSDLWDICTCIANTCIEVHEERF